MLSRFIETTAMRLPAASGEDSQAAARRTAFSGVSAIEREVFPDKRPAVHTYLITGSWMTRPGVLLRGVLLRPVDTHIVPVMAGKAALKGFVRSQGTSRAHCLADIVHIREHFSRTGVVRSFYLDSRPVSVKAWLGGQGGPTSRETEVLNRQRVHDLGALAAPTILSHGIVGSCEYLVEQLTNARVPVRSSDRQHLANVLLPALQTHYSRTDLSILEFRECMGDRFLDGIETAAGHVEWRSNWMSRAELLRRIGDICTSGRVLVSSLAHGDLNLSHIGLSRDGAVTILDWEGARPMPVAADLADLDRTCGAGELWFRRACGGVITSLTNGRSILSPDEQMAALALRRAGRWDEMRELRQMEGTLTSIAHRLAADFSYASRLLLTTPQHN